MILVACVGVHYQFGPCPQIFSRALAQSHGWAAWLNWQGIPSAELKLWHPRALRLSPSRPAPDERGGLPSLALPPSNAHVAFWHFGPLSKGRPCPFHYPGHLDPWPSLADFSVPGVPSTQYSTFHSHAPSRSMDSCTLQKGLEPSLNTNNKTSFW